MTTRAFLVGKVNDVWTRRIEDVSLDALGDGDVLVKVEWSCINYKDGLASSEKGRVARIDPLIPGVDLAGTIVEPGNSGLAVGTPVIAHGYDVGVAHHGGYATHARVSSQWIVPMPSGLTTKTAMMVGTAGFTAALSVDALERAGLRPGTGPVLVTGATGFLGSAVAAELLENHPGVTPLFLVRAADAAQGLARLRDALAKLGVPQARQNALTPDHVLLGDLKGFARNADDPRVAALHGVPVWRVRLQLLRACNTAQYRARGKDEQGYNLHFHGHSRTPRQIASAQLSTGEGLRALHVVRAQHHNLV